MAWLWGDTYFHEVIFFSFLNSKGDAQHCEWGQSGVYEECGKCHTACEWGGCHTVFRGLHASGKRLATSVCCATSGT